MRTFAVGEILEVKVLSVIDRKRVVVDIDGSFFQVENLTQLLLQPGDKIKLTVDSVKPLRLKMAKQTRNGQRSFHI